MRREEDWMEAVGSLSRWRVLRGTKGLAAPAGGGGVGGAKFTGDTLIGLT